jgi:hypothetical protein
MLWQWDNVTGSYIAQPRAHESMDLNQLAIRSDSPNSEQDIPFEDYRVMQASGDGICVYFRDLESQLIDRIRQAECIIGCVAWLTNERILRALATVPYGVALVIQKEDFLRPDLASHPHWAAHLRTLYNMLPGGLQRDYSTTILHGMSVCSDPTIDAVRCVGNYNQDKQPAFPRMHHKFLVFSRLREVSDPSSDYNVMEPYAVWTGSFNFTANSSHSLENAIYLPIPSIALAYLQEWAQITAISEPLDWRSAWVSPEWRLGT